MEWVFVIGCGEGIDHACRAIDEFIFQDDCTLADPELMGVVSELEDGSLKFMVPVRTSADNYRGF